MRRERLFVDERRGERERERSGLGVIKITKMCSHILSNNDYATDPLWYANVALGR